MSKNDSGTIIECPMEYGPRFEEDGVSRGFYGECICKAHGEKPCSYLKMADSQPHLKSPSETSTTTIPEGNDVD